MKVKHFIVKKCGNSKMKLPKQFQLYIYRSINVQWIFPNIIATVTQNLLEKLRKYQVTDVTKIAYLFICFHVCVYEVFG